MTAARPLQVFILTMGCAKNEADSAAMKKRLERAGYRVISDPLSADVVVVNTCSFIQSATEESLEAILDMADLPTLQEHRAVLVVTGCMPARYGEELADELTEVQAFVPCDKEADIVQVIAEVAEKYGLPKEDLAAPASSAEGQWLEWVDADAETEQYFRYIKIADGCDRRCSYCTIPQIRGPYRSFTLDVIKSQIDDAQAEGAKEIVLIAQDTGRWGKDLTPASNLATLLDTLAKDYPDLWIRILYIQPDGITDELLETIDRHSNICSYLDLPLQHCDGTILRAMNRAGSRDSFEELFERILKKVPDATLRTTLIVGFPGETEEQFEELCDFVAESPFSYIGIFPYSQEEGTKAAELPDQLDEDTKVERATQLGLIAEQVCSEHIRERVGQALPFLVEGTQEDGQLYGRCQCQAPEVDGLTFVDQGSIGSFETIDIEDTLLYDMEGTARL